MDPEFVVRTSYSCFEFMMIFTDLGEVSGPGSGYAERHRYHGFGASLMRLAPACRPDLPSALPTNER